MTKRSFEVKKEEEGFLLGHFEGEHFSGAFLSPEYIGRLREIRSAVGRRLEAMGDNGLSDALKNLLGVIDRLTRAHAAQARTEGYPGSEADRAEIAAIEKELAELKRQLEDFPKGPGSPKKK